MTRRRALVLGAVAGLGSLARRPGDAVAIALPARGRAARSFHLDVPGDAFLGGRRTGVLRAPARFDLLGLRGAGVRDAGMEVRVRTRGGSWSPWTALGRGAEHAPDGRRRGTLAATDPVWAGGAQELQLRARRPVGGLRVHFVAVGRRARKAGARASVRARAAQKAKAAQGGGPPPIITRVQWGADGVPPRAEPSFGSVQMAFVHHTVSANDYAPEDSPGIVLSICKYHRDTNGWNDIGYNFLVDQYGQVFEGRAGGVDQAVIGAQAQGWNSVSTGVATIGTFSDVPLATAGVEAVSRLIAWKLTLHGVPCTGQVTVKSAGGAENRYRSGAMVTFERLSGHRDGCSTTCPGDQLYAQMPSIRTRAAQLAGAVTAAAPPKLTIGAAGTVVGYGDDAVFAGTLADPAGGGMPGAAVSVQKQATSGWVTVARTTTGADGTWSARLPWKRAAAVRAVFKSGATAVRSGPVTVGLEPRLGFDAAPRRVQAGRTLVVRGAVAPAGPVAVAVEFSRDGVRWSRVGSVRARVRGGRWSARVAARRPGLYRLTPSTGPAAKRVRARSSVLRAVRRQADVRRASPGSNGAVATPPTPPTPAGPSPGGVAATA
jgi:hypothetical protein